MAKLAKWLGSFQTVIGVAAIGLGIWVLISGAAMLQAIVAIVAGLVLALGILPLIPALGKYIHKFAAWLGSFQTIIGIVALVIGVLGLV